MQKAYPDISDEVREQLSNKGLRAWTPKPIADWLNPHKSSCIINK